MIQHINAHHPPPQSIRHHRLQQCAVRHPKHILAEPHPHQHPEGRRHPVGLRKQDDEHAAPHQSQKGRNPLGENVPCQRYEHRGDKPAHSYRSRQRAPGIRAPVQHLRSEHRQHKNQRLKHQVGYQRQQNQLQNPLLILNIAQPRQHTRHRRLPGRRPLRAVGQLHRQQHQHNQHIQRRLQKEIPLEPQQGNQQPANGRRNNPRAGIHHPVQRQSPGQRIPRHRIGYHRLPHRLDNRMGNAGYGHIDERMPPAQRPPRRFARPIAADNQQGKQNGRHRHRRLGNHHQLAPVNAVAQHPGPRPDNQYRNRADTHRRAGQQGVAVRQLQHQPTDGQHLQPLRANGKKVPNPDEPEIPILPGYRKRAQPGHPPPPGAFRRRLPLRRVSRHKSQKGAKGSPNPTKSGARADLNTIRPVSHSPFPAINPPFLL